MAQLETMHDSLAWPTSNWAGPQDAALRYVEHARCSPRCGDNTQSVHHGTITDERGWLGMGEQHGAQTTSNCVDKWHYRGGGGHIAVQARDQVAGSGGVSTLQPRRGCAGCPYAACWGEDGCGAVPWWPRKDGRVPSGAVQRSLSRRDGTAHA
jgi:hypothetical protein